MNTSTTLISARNHESIAHALERIAKTSQDQGQTETARLALALDQAYKGTPVKDLTSPVAIELAKHLTSPNFLRANGPAMDKIYALAVQEHGTPAADATIGQLMAVAKYAKNS